MDGRDHWTTSPLEHRSLSGANKATNVTLHFLGAGILKIHFQKYPFYKAKLFWYKYKFKIKNTQKYSLANKLWKKYTLTNYLAELDYCRKIICYQKVPTNWLGLVLEMFMHLKSTILEKRLSFGWNLVKILKFGQHFEIW